MTNNPTSGCPRSWPPTDQLLHEFTKWGAATSVGWRATSLINSGTGASDSVASRLNETGGGDGDELATAYLWALLLSDPDTVTT